MPLNESNVVARARRLLVYTIDAANFSDKMDIIFVAEMIEKFGKFVEKFKDVRTFCPEPFRRSGRFSGSFSMRCMRCTPVKSKSINAQQLFFCHVV